MYLCNLSICSEALVISVVLSLGTGVHSLFPCVVVCFQAPLGSYFENVQY